MTRLCFLLFLLSSCERSETKTMATACHTLDTCLAEIQRESGMALANITLGPSLVLWLSVAPLREEEVNIP